MYAQVRLGEKGGLKLLVCDVPDGQHFRREHSISAKELDLMRQRSAQIPNIEDENDHAK